MTSAEFEYLKRAMTALGDPNTTDMARLKILRTMSQICGAAATDIENELVDKVDARLYTNITVND
jgi:hypothetical protein